MTRRLYNYELCPTESCMENNQLLHLIQQTLEILNYHALQATLHLTSNSYEISNIPFQLIWKAKCKYLNILFQIQSIMTEPIYLLQTTP